MISMIDTATLVVVESHETSELSWELIQVIIFRELVIILTVTLNLVVVLVLLGK